MERRMLGLLVAALAGTGCGSDSETETPNGPPPDSGCTATEVRLPDGSCLTVGVPPEACAEGFEAVAGGCYPVLPPEPCPPGLMAIPGDTVCREVAPCGEGTWGEIPIEPGAVFVDGSYAGGDSDGSETRPFTTVVEAVATAPPNGMIAIAAGSYAGQIEIVLQTVRLWGRCPAMVELVAEPGDDAAVLVLNGAEGTEVHTLAARGADVGIVFAGSTGLWMDRVWIHDTAGHGVDVAPTHTPGAGTITGSLIEATTESAVLVYGATAEIVASNIRGTAGGPRGITAQQDELPSSLVVRQSLIEASTEAGVALLGADGLLERVAVRHTVPHPVYGAGRGVDSLASSIHRNQLTLRQSSVQLSHEAGVSVTGGDLLVEHATVGTTQAGTLQPLAPGINAQIHTSLDARSTATVLASLIESNHGDGLTAGVSDIHVEQVLVRGTANADGTKNCRGIAVSTVGDWPGRSTGTILRSLVAQNEGSGIVVLGSEATIEQTEVRDQWPSPGFNRGHGIAVAIDFLAGVRAGAVVTDVTVARATEVGIMVSGSDAVIERAVVRDTRVNPESQFGDGVIIVGYTAVASAYLNDSRIEQSARAGGAAFGATLSVGGTVFDCNPIQLNGERYQEVDFTFEDLGGNQCGCGDEQVTCQISSSNLSPPDPAVGH